MRLSSIPILVLMLGLPFVALAVPSTDELIALKNSGVSEEIVQVIVESGYGDLARVIQLKKAGFKDDTILSVIKADLKEAKAPASSSANGDKKAASEAIDAQTSARMKIQWYMVYRGNAMLQNSQDIDVAKISMIGGKTLRFEWTEKGGLGLLDLAYRKSFSSPFYWDIDKQDTTGPGAAGYSYALKSASGHRGRPDTDASHYWVVSFEPAGQELARWIEKARSAK